MNNTKKLQELLELTINESRESLSNDGSMSISQIEAIDRLSRLIQDSANDTKETSPQYSLLYTKLNGATDTYKINNIVFMDRHILKAVVEGKGYRSFRTDRVISLIPE